MPRYVAFLRAVNIGGTRTVHMDVLRQIFQDLGYSEVESFLASGNIIFETHARSTSALEEQIEKGLIEGLGYEVTPFVRTRSELEQILDFHPFRRSHLDVGDQLAVLFLSTAPDMGTQLALRAASSKLDEFRVHGREIYWLRHTIQDGGTYSTAPLDKVLKQVFTIRTLSTVRRVTEKYFLDAEHA
jgi:uncharacterized protein (DUF1697 family)